MHPSEILRLFLDAPFGLVIYEPLISDRGVLEDVVLRWHNAPSQRLIDIDLDAAHDKRLSEFAPGRWEALRPRWAKLIADHEPFSYSHVAPNDIAFTATVWYSVPYIALKIRETSEDGILISDAKEIGAALKLLATRTERTLALAAMLAEHPEAPIRLDD